jgi:hypothetical protein
LLFPFVPEKILLTDQAGSKLMHGA